MSTKRDTEQQIDRLLLAQGEYDPLTFLLQEGRLSYGDYEAWRNGEISDLSEMLFGDPAQIADTLRHAADYFKRRGWESERLVYRQIGGTDARPLRFSRESRLDEAFHWAYRKPGNQPQLDLFCDTSTTFSVNGITQALKTLNAGDARASLQRLYETAPDHIHLGELERLVEVLEDLDSPPSDLEAEMQRLLTETVPLAERHLDKACNHLLIPLWRRLSGALLNHPFDPSRADLHSSYASAQARDWQGVRLAVEGESDWRCQAILLERHARASTQLGDQAAALLGWFLLCWQFPHLSDRLERCDDRTLADGWQRFLDLEPELPAEDFPAWLLSQIPGLARIAPDGDGDHPGPDSYRTLVQLLHSSDDTTDEHAMALRARLKQQSPDLFRHFLASL